MTWSKQTINKCEEETTIDYMCPVRQYRLLRIRQAADARGSKKRCVRIETHEIPIEDKGGWITPPSQKTGTRSQELPSVRRTRCTIVTHVQFATTNNTHQLVRDAHMSRPHQKNSQARLELSHVLQICRWYSGGCDKRQGWTCRNNSRISGFLSQTP